MKESKGKEVVGEGSRPEVQLQIRPSTGDKRETLPKNLDLGSPPSRQAKRPNMGRPKWLSPASLHPSRPSRFFDVDSSIPIVTSKTPPSKTIVPALSQPCERFIQISLRMKI